MTVLTLPYPPSVNTIWRRVGSKTLLSAKGRDYRAMVARSVMTQGGGSHYGPETRLSVDLLVIPPDRRRRDLDNLPKAIFDALTHAGVWADDSQIDRMTIERMEPSKAAPDGCVTLTIRAKARELEKA